MVNRYRTGDRVIFCGRSSDLGRYSADLAQLIGHTGVVVQADARLAMIDVQFQGLTWQDTETGQRSDVFPVLRSELKLMQHKEQHT
jgi:hypothetical protein